jgi:hypothetical protein
MYLAAQSLQPAATGLRCGGANTQTNLKNPMLSRA